MVIVHRASFLINKHSFFSQPPKKVFKVNAARKSKVDDNTAKMQSIKQLGV